MCVCGCLVSWLLYVKSTGKGCVCVSCVLASVSEKYRKGCVCVGDLPLCDITLLHICWGKNYRNYKKKKIILM